MFILRDLLVNLQTPFSDSRLGRERAHWFVFTLLAVIVPFTSSMTSNLLRALQTLFGLDLNRRRFLYLHGFEHAALGKGCGRYSESRYLIPRLKGGCWSSWMIRSITRPDARSSVAGSFTIIPPSAISRIIPGSKTSSPSGC